MNDSKLDEILRESARRSRKTLILFIGISLAATVLVVVLLALAENAAKRECKGKGGIYKCKTMTGTIMTDKGPQVGSMTSCTCIAKDGTEIEMEDP